MYFVWFPKCPYRALSQTPSKCGTLNCMNSEKQGQEHIPASGRVFSKYRWSIFGLSVLFIERDSWEGLQKSLWKTRLGNAVCDKQKYDVTKRSCKEPHSWVVGPWLWRSAQAILPSEWEGKWDDAAGIWIKDEWARCLLLVLFAQNYCQRHCKRGVRFTLVAFENFSTLFSPSDFSSYNMGATADSTAVDRRVYFPQFFAFPQFPCIFFMHAKINLNQRGKEMKLRGSCAKLSP